MMWRYTILYMTERCYESGGRVWDQVFQNVCWCLFICIFFTGAPPSFARAPLPVQFLTCTPRSFCFTETRDNARSLGDSRHSKPRVLSC